METPVNVIGMKIRFKAVASSIGVTQVFMLVNLKTINHTVIELKLG
jgi:hypothetical protein